MSTGNRFDPDPKRRLDETLAAIALVFRRYDSLAVAVVVTAGYVATFLWATGDLAFRPDVAANLVVVDDPLARAFERTGPVSFEAVALLDTGVVRLLIAPVNMAIGLSIAGLVGVNLGLTYLAVAQSAACGLDAGAGLFASMPALLSGTVCCGPVVLIALGIQASGFLLTLFVWVLPLGLVLLLSSLVYVAGTIDIAGAAQ